MPSNAAVSLTPPTPPDPHASTAPGVASVPAATARRSTSRQVRSGIWLDPSSRLQCLFGEPEPNRRCFGRVMRIGPAARHHFATGEEMYTVGAVRVGVAEQ